MSQQGAGGVLIVRIEMHLAAAMKILRNATNNLQGRLLSQAFFAHLSLFIIYSATVLYLLRRTHHPNSKGLGNRPSPHLQKKLSQHKGPHMQRWCSTGSSLRGKGLWRFMHTFQKGLDKDWAPSRDKKHSAATKALSYTRQKSQAKMPPKVCLYSALRMNGENQRCTRMLKRCQVQLTKFHLNTRLPPANMQFFPCVARAAKDCSRRHNDSNDSWKGSFKIGKMKKPWKIDMVRISHRETETRFCFQ